jgi:steroid delta-isomerase-like uncharacterized protein
MSSTIQQEEENIKSKVRLFYDVIINQSRFELLSELLDEKVVWHDPLLPSGEVRGINGFRNVLEMFRKAFPDLRITIQDLFASKDRVTTRFVINATHIGELMDIPGTGKHVQVSGISIIRFEHGKMVEEWIEEDGLGLMRQLGVQS